MPVAVQPTPNEQAAPIVLILLHLGEQYAALRLESVERITPMAELAHPPGLPSAMEGILNLSGAAVPVLRLDRLLALPSACLGLYSMLVVLKGAAPIRIAIIVDRVSEVFSVAAHSLLAVSPEDSFNGCFEATVLVNERPVPVLCPARLLVRKEREALLGFQKMAEMRLGLWQIS